MLINLGIPDEAQPQTYPDPAPKKLLSLRNPHTYLSRIPTDFRKLMEYLQTPASILNIFLSAL